MNGAPWKGASSHQHKKRTIPYINVLLFALTLISTTIAGAFLRGANPFTRPSALVEGLPFSLSLMLILSAHEFGHYLASRRVSVESTLPFFIPAPPPVGTFGAIIKMRSTVTNRKALMAIGAAGPVAGFLVALPVVILGLHLSTYGVSQPQDSGFALGPSLLFSLLTRAVMGVSPADYDVYLHPVAFAGWWGFFITALNLLPIGQTDGGHVIYSVFGKHHRWVSQAVFFILLPMGFFLWPGWLMWAVVMLVLRLRHPPLLDESTELETKYKLLGVLVLLIFVLTFVPTPFQITF